MVVTAEVFQVASWETSFKAAQPSNMKDISVMVETSQPITYSRLRSAAAPWKRPFKVVVFTFGLP